MVRRAVGFKGKADITRIREKIKFAQRRPVTLGRPISQQNRSSKPSNRKFPTATIKDDAAYEAMQEAVDSKIAEFNAGALKLGRLQSIQLRQAIFQQAVNPVNIVTRFSQYLSLLTFTDDANRLNMLQRAQEEDRKELREDSSGRVQVRIEVSNTPKDDAAFVITKKRKAGEHISPVEFRHFQQNALHTTRAARDPIRTLRVCWSVAARDGTLNLADYNMSSLLKATLLSTSITLNLKQDTEAFREWLRRAEDP
jgi:hypothetical protein